MTAPKKIIVVAGARPNFMKIALLMNALKKKMGKRAILVHTGQHYDYQMSEVFFQELKIPKPDIFLNVGSCSHGKQTGMIMDSFETVAIKEKPSLVVVAGDVNSTLACSLVSAKLNIKVAHIEAGLRSFDREMPEEINRLATDAVSDILFVSEESGLKNLRSEGVASDKVIHVGNVMIDSLIHNFSSIERSGILEKLRLQPKKYGVLTLHRPSNVDTKEALLEIYNILKAVCSKVRLVYPIHPRTKAKITAFALGKMFDSLADLSMVEPLGYLDFIKLVKESCFVLTDSGGIQEETTYLKVPCLTMRENTERPSTVSEGTNELVGRDRKAIMAGVSRALAGKWKKSRIPKYWDGRSTERILKVMSRI